MNLIFNFQEFISAFVVLFAIIDIVGTTPLILDFKSKGKNINAGKASIYSLIIFIAFLFIGEAVLKLFGVNIESFAVAGALVIFVVAIEMIFGIEIFKNDGPSDSATIVPIVFPFIAGTGSLTTLLSLRAEYNILNIILAILLNMVIVYFVVKKASLIEGLIGKGGIYILRKFFGVILLAISVKLFSSNLFALIESLKKFS